MQTALVHRVFFLALVFAAGCMAMLATRDESGLQFTPLVADAVVSFEIADRRPTETKTFHKRDMYAVESFFYGDLQFFPDRVRALATRFAEAFPDAPRDATLTIERFDIGHRVVRGQEPRGACSFWGDCLATLIATVMDEADKSRNLVLIRLSGTFNGIAFDVTEQYQYLHYDIQAQPIRVVSVLDRTISAAVREVREQMVPPQQRRPDVADRLPTPLPRIELPRDDLPQQSLRGSPVFKVDSTVENDVVKKNIDDAMQRTRPCFTKPCASTPNNGN